MEPIEYQLTEEDLLRWNQYYSARSSYHRRYFMMFRLVVPCILLTLGLLELLSGESVVALSYTLVAVLWFLFARWMHRSLMRMKVRSLAKEGYQQLLKEPIVLAPENDGIYCRSYVGETLYEYRVIERIDEDKGYTYIQIGKGMALILPHDRIGKKVVDAFVTAVERKCEVPAGASAPDFDLVTEETRPGQNQKTRVKIIQVDSFTDIPFRGNPAAVCILGKGPPETWMQCVAAEMNLSETAFLIREEDGFSIRYFTPLIEVELCGHATLASAHVLWEEGIVSGEEEIVFHSKSGELRASREGDWICLDFPAYDVEETEIPDGLADVLRADPVKVSSVGGTGLLAELESEEAVRDLQPDFGALRAQGFGPVSVTAESHSKDYDFVSRFFWPAAGVDEDPVTGAAHCSLGPYWAARMGKTDLVGRQLSRRGGTVRVRVREARVDILGKAVTVMRGEIVVDTKSEDWPR